MSVQIIPDHSKVEYDWWFGMSFYFRHCYLVRFALKYVQCLHNVKNIGELMQLFALINNRAAHESNLVLLYEASSSTQIAQNLISYSYLDMARTQHMLQP